MILVYPIAHGKVMVMDHATVQTGSFNYSNAAARQNSENVVVNWQNAGLAAAYLAHFERNWNQGVPYETHY